MSAQSDPPAPGVAEITFDSLPVGQRFSYTDRCGNTWWAEKDGQTKWTYWHAGKGPPTYGDSNEGWYQGGGSKYPPRRVVELLDANWKPMPSTPPPAPASTEIRFDTLPIGQRFSYRDPTGSRLYAKKLADDEWGASNNKLTVWAENDKMRKWDKIGVAHHLPRRILKLYDADWKEMEVMSFDTKGISFNTLAMGQMFHLEAAGSHYLGQKRDASTWWYATWSGYDTSEQRVKKCVAASLGNNFVGVSSVQTIKCLFDTQGNEIILGTTATNPTTTTVTPSPATNNTKDTSIMVFNVLATQKVTKKNEDGTLQAVERLLTDQTIVAADGLGAAFIAGRKLLETAVSDEELSTASVKVTQRN